MNSLYEPHLFGSCIRELGKSTKGSPLFVQWHPFSRKEERKKESSLPQFISLSCSFLSSLSFPLFSCCVQKGNSILLFNFALYNNFTTVIIIMSCFIFFLMIPKILTLKKYIFSSFLFKKNPIIKVKKKGK